MKCKAMFSFLKLSVWASVHEKGRVYLVLARAFLEVERLSTLSKINNGHRALRGWREIRGNMVRAHINTLFLFNLFLHTEHSVS